MARFANGKAPFLRAAEDKSQTTQAIMRNFIIGLIPVILFSWYKNGIQVYLDGNISFLEMLYPLLFILLGGIFTFFFEAMFYYITDEQARSIKGMLRKQALSFSLIPGLILALILPLYTPIWVLIFGSFMAAIVGKMLFGGFGYNIWNPALVGYVAIMFTLLGVINNAGGYLNASEVLIDSYAGATPLSSFAIGKAIDYDLLVAPYGNLWNFFLGTIPGAIGETSALVILISYLWYSYKKVIKWFMPLIYVGFVFLLTWFIGIINGDAGVWFPLYGILSGGVMFGAVFMLTEPVTSPKNPLGKVFFALYVAALTVLFRYIGSAPEGVATSIIAMNLFSIPIDRWSSIIRANGVNKSTVGKLIFLIGLLLVIVLYTVLKSQSVFTLGIFLGGVF